MSARGIFRRCRIFDISGISRCSPGLHFLADGFALFAVGAHEFVVELEIHPHAGGDPKTAAFALLHLGEVGRGNSAAAGDLRLRQAGFLVLSAEGLGEEVEQRDGLRFLFHGGGSVVVGDLHVGGAAVFPTEDDAPLVIDADAPESLEIAGKRSEAIGWWLAESHQCAWLNVAGKLAGVSSIEDFGGFLADKISRDCTSPLPDLITISSG